MDLYSDYDKLADDERALLVSCTDLWDALGLWRRRRYFDLPPQVDWMQEHYIPVWAVSGADPGDGKRANQLGYTDREHLRDMFRDNRLDRLLLRDPFNQKYRRSHVGGSLRKLGELLRDPRLRREFISPTP